MNLLFDIKIIIFEINNCLIATSNKFSLIIGFNSIVPIIVISTVFIINNHVWTTLDYDWLWITAIIYLLLGIFQIYQCANVSTYCDKLIFNIYHRKIHKMKSMQAKIQNGIMAICNKCFHW